ncbi:MAG: right-handed parallel beta-helix repeat-containing protein, partial [Thermoplasmata archaeon]|nr:right-handed parallel beta-helix repeat-containing protein [Thermoplasmata archaeon]
MRRRGSIEVVLFVVSILLLSNIFNFNATEARSSIDTSYDPFYLIGDNETLIAHYHIQGDEELIQFVGAYGTGGSGSSVDPYNVSGLYVPVDSGEECGLLIENTTLHISFDDIEIKHASYQSMVISNCSNIFLNSLTTHDLMIKSSSNITVIDITLTLDVHIYDSQGIDIRENRAYLYIYFYDSQDIRIRNNNCTVSSTGFYFTNCIDVDIDNNTFKSTRYFLLITANCNMILVRNNTFLGDKNGLSLSGDRSSLLRIYGNIFRSYNDACIWINSGNYHIYDNYFEENRNGLHIRFNSNSSITGNIFTDNYYSTMDFYGEWNSHSKHTINNNTFYYNRGSDSFYDRHIRQIPDTIEQAGYDQYNFDGNFWFDWRKMDDENEDGIIDEPYILGPNETYEKDNYPMAKSPHRPNSPKIEMIERKGDYVMINWSPVIDRFFPILDYTIWW